MSFIKKVSTLRTFHKVAVCGIFLAVFFFLHDTAHAATLSLSPSGGSYAVGKTISVRVLVGSGGQSINAVSGVVSFSNDTLTLTGISKSGVITLWAQDPTYSNSSSSASFQGVILNGYSGGAGTVVTLTFRAKAEGAATVSISGSGSSVLLNDGKGTNVLSGTSGASFTIIRTSTPPATPEPTTPVTVPTVPETPVTPTVPLLTPTFTDYANPLLPGNFVVVKGTGSPNSIVTITFTQGMPDGTNMVKQVSVPTTDTGTFAYVSDEKASEGITYTLVATNQEGQHTAPLVLNVKNSWLFIATGLIASIIAIKISALLALLILLIISGYLLYRNHVLKKRLEMVVDQLRQSPPKL
ncbi:MAG: hypothetical protein JWL92_308 [Candidatus Nomurabacteria bacterium]|nr:hypothetical protein [Candidatus Nomurabacteria bacterium]